MFRYLVFLLFFTALAAQPVHTGYASGPAVIDDKDIAHLPAPVRKFLHQTRTIGKPAIRKVALVQSGTMKLKPGGGWIDLKADQVFDLDSISFEWTGSITAAPLMKVSAVDRYSDGIGSLKIRLWSLIPIGTEEGEDISRAELMRYLSELIWFPSGFLSDSITWKTVNDSTVNATIRDGGLEASGQFTFPENGMVRFRAPRMAEIEKGNPKLLDWETVTTGYRETSGYYLPSEGVALYHLPEGRYEYIRVKIEKIDFTY